MNKRWLIKVVPEAIDDFYKLPVEIRTRIREKLRHYRQYEVITGCAQHLGTQAPGWYEFRVGKYRVVFEPMFDKISIEVYGTITIFGVCLRNKAYRILVDRWNKYCP